MNTGNPAITDHHDGHGLAELLRIFKDDPDPNAGGASHNYQVVYGSGPGRAGRDCARIQFQHGPRKRADDRAKRSVLGKNEK